MCGIAGYLNTAHAPADAAIAHAMNITLAHRGPDADGVVALGPVALAHRRLAILDLSDAGIQPMSDATGTLWVTFNGEIYNFAAVRAELEAHGHTFRTHTDTEVILYAYRQWGQACVHKFNGMFAFALWDATAQRLWLVRDRLGIKPLFYALLPGKVVFGSEIKAVLAHPDVPRALDAEALAYFLALNYTPAPYTLFGAVRQLLPGHMLHVDADGTVSASAYWDIPQPTGERRSPQAWGDALHTLLDDAVRLRMVSDVPFGAFLSGGVDSSTVAHFMAQHMRAPLKTFTIAFDQPDFDETPWARAVAQHLHADHHEQTVTANMADVLPTLVHHAEEPTADSSMVAVYYLAKLARQHVTMVQAGDGADELFAGYGTYSAQPLHQLLRRVPRGVRQHVLMRLIDALPVRAGKSTFDFKARRFVRAGDLSPEDAHASWRQIVDAPTRAALLAPLLARGEAGAAANVFDQYRAVFAQAGPRRALDRMLYADTRFYLPNDMLVKVDRMTMAHGLEARTPFLDYRVVALAASIPPGLKRRGLFGTKHILKTIMRPHLPAQVLARKKQGFAVPNARWLKGDMRAFATDVLAPARVAATGALEPVVVARLLDDHFRNRADHSHQLWGLLTFMLWWERWLGPGTSAGSARAPRPEATHA